jgi:hypothetical protein
MIRCAEQGRFTVPGATNVYVWGGHTRTKVSEDVDFLEFATALKQMQNSDVKSSSMARDNSGPNTFINSRM